MTAITSGMEALAQMTVSTGTYFFLFFYEWFFRREKSVHEVFCRDGACQKRYKRVDREKQLR